MHIIN